jgi:outer membrane protein OmpA-like peptidoglycan-associated protein
LTQPCVDNTLLLIAAQAPRINASVWESSMPTAHPKSNAFRPTAKRLLTVAIAAVVLVSCTHAPLLPTQSAREADENSFWMGLQMSDGSGGVSLEVEQRLATRMVAWLAQSERQRNQLATLGAFAPLSYPLRNSAAPAAVPGQVQPSAPSPNGQGPLALLPLPAASAPALSRAAPTTASTAPVTTAAVPPVVAPAPTAADPNAGIRLRIEANFESWHGRVMFAYASDDLSRSARNHLQRLVQPAKQSTRVDVIGRTDASGDPQRNERLALGRALAVRDYFVERGVSKEKFFTAAMACVDDSAQCNSADNELRRVEIGLYRSPKAAAESPFAVVKVASADVATGGL